MCREASHLNVTFRWLTDPLPALRITLVLMKHRQRWEKVQLMDVRWDCWHAQTETDNRYLYSSLRSLRRFLFCQLHKDKRVRIFSRQSPRLFLQTLDAAVVCPYAWFHSTEKWTYLYSLTFHPNQVMFISILQTSIGTNRRLCVLFRMSENSVSLSCHSFLSCFFPFVLNDNPASKMSASH